mgnify:CR=1 FL=1
MIAAVYDAFNLLEADRIQGVRINTEIDQERTHKRILVQYKSATILWTRFYDLETAKPNFCDRDGIKKNTLAEIGHERRNGYSWYTNAPSKILKEYPKWKKKVDEN